MIRSEGWNPVVRWSRSLNPEGTPVTSSFFSKSLSIVLKLDLTISRMEKVVQLFRDLRKKLLTKYTGDIV